MKGRFNWQQYNSFLRILGAHLRGREGETVNTSFAPKSFIQRGGEKEGVEPTAVESCLGGKALAVFNKCDNGGVGPMSPEFIRWITDRFPTPEVRAIPGVVGGFYTCLQPCINRTVPNAVQRRCDECQVQFFYIKGVQRGNTMAANNRVLGNELPFTEKWS